MDIYYKITVGITTIVLVLLLSWLCIRHKIIGKTTSFIAYLAVLIGLLFYFVNLISRFSLAMESLKEAGIPFFNRIGKVLSHGTTYTEFATFATLIGLVAIFEQNRKEQRSIAKVEIQQPEKSENNIFRNPIVGPPVTIKNENQDIPENKINSNSTPNFLLGILAISLLTIVLHKRNKV